MGNPPFRRNCRIVGKTRWRAEKFRDEVRRVPSPRILVDDLDLLQAEEPKISIRPVKWELCYAQSWNSDDDFQPFAIQQIEHLSEGPLGCFSPISHCRTVATLVLRMDAKMAWLILYLWRRARIDALDFPAQVRDTKSRISSCGASRSSRRHKDHARFRGLPPGCGWLLSWLDQRS